MTPKVSDAEIRAAQEALVTHGSVSLAAKKLGLARSTLQHRLKMMPSASKPAQEKQMPQKVKRGKALSDFVAEHDRDYIIPKKIRESLQELGRSWEYEQDFIRSTQISAVDLGNYREQFEEYWVVVGRTGKRAWTGSKDVAREMRTKVR